MIIDSLINRNYYAASILEDMQQIAVWLKEHDELAIIDENAQTVGIVEARDVVNNYDRMVASSDISKPSVTPWQTIPEVFKLMKENHTECLPVYNQESFVGIITLRAITERLLVLLDQLTNESQLV